MRKVPQERNMELKSVTTIFIDEHSGDNLGNCGNQIGLFCIRNTTH